MRVTQAPVFLDKSWPPAEHDLHAISMIEARAPRLAGDAFIPRLSRMAVGAAGVRRRGGGVIMMGRMSRVFALLGVARWLGWSGQALAAARVALVVGNGDYAAEIGKLKNPTSDAQLRADTLTGLGFEVALVT